MVSAEDSVGPYADAVEEYLKAGWRGILPLPPGRKTPPPDGYTGAQGVDPTIDQLARWVEQRATGNIGLRMPPNVVGIDVDQYGAKVGATSLVTVEASLGPLPPTWWSTARSWPSAIRFYTVPRDSVIILGKAGPDIDIIHRGYRYAVVWPSIHPDTGGLYLWHEPDGRVGGGPPGPGDHAELPAAWLAFLTGADQLPPGGEGEGELGNFPAGPPTTNGTPGPRHFRRRPVVAYGRAALARELGILWLAEVGDRNNQLNVAAFNLGQLVAGGVLDRDEVVEHLAEMARVIGLEDDEVKKTLLSGLTSGMAKPRIEPTISINSHNKDFRQ